MRVFAAAAALTVLGCTTTPPNDGVAAVPPAIPVSDPIHPVQATVYEQLGLRVRSDDSPYVLLDKEPAFRLIGPNARLGIVPVARLHERLNRLQIESLRTQQPVVRYEVIDL